MRRIRSGGTTGRVDPPSDARRLRFHARASPNDPKHPGYPAGVPDGKGGKFRPKDVPGGMSPEERLKQVGRLAQRKTLKSILGRVLSAKRVLRMIGRYVEGEIVEDIPVVNDIVGIQSFADDLDLAQAMAGDEAESNAAVDFVKNGPYDTPQSFSSFDAFKKTELEKQFGPAGDGYDYHHIVEQGPNAEALSRSLILPSRSFATLR